jgi:hypothetical protein
LVFTDTSVSFSAEGVDGSGWGFTGTYTYDPPKVTITANSPENFAGLISSGKVEISPIYLDKETKIGREAITIGINYGNFIDEKFLIKQ